MDEVVLDIPEATLEIPECPKLNIDWVDLKSEYIGTPNVSYADIAHEHNVSLKTVKKHGAKEEWVAERQKVSKKVEIAVIESMIQDRVTSNNRHREMWLEAQDLVFAQFEIIKTNTEQIKRKAELGGQPVTFRELYSAERLLHLIKAMSLAVNGERVTLELPTSITASTESQLFEQMPNYTYWTTAELEAEVKRFNIEIANNV